MRAAGVALVVLLVAGAQPSTATTMQRLDLNQLTSTSTGIVIGEVQVVRSHWNSAHTRIVTDVELRVRESIKGTATGLAVITELGGEVDGVRMSVPGCPAFSVGEEVLLFLWSRTPADIQVTGLEQGKFEIERDPATGARYLQRQASGWAVSELRSLSAVPEGKPAPRWTVEQMVREIRASMARTPHGERER